MRIKSPREIELLRAANQVVYRVLTELGAMVRPGVTTAELDTRAEALIRDAGGEPLFKGVVNPDAKWPFPASICASVNEQVVHGVPGDRPLVEGDIISIDCGVRLKNYCGDAARTFGVGEISAEAQRLLDVTRQTLEIAKREMAPGGYWGEIAAQMQACVEDAGFGVVRRFVGHGIGQEMHEEPKVPNYFDRSVRDSDFELVPGMVLAIEPMVTVGADGEVKFGDETGWPIVSRDGSLAAHFEDSIAVVEDGIQVLSTGEGEYPQQAGG